MGRCVVRWGSLGFVGLTYAFWSCSLADWASGSSFALAPAASQVKLWLYESRYASLLLTKFHCTSQSLSLPLSQIPRYHPIDPLTISQRIARA